jgi:hypothetical protein
MNCVSRVTPTGGQEKTLATPVPPFLPPFSLSSPPEGVTGRSPAGVSGGGDSPPLVRLVLARDDTTVLGHSKAHAGVALPPQPWKRGRDRRRGGMCDKGARPTCSGRAARAGIGLGALTMDVEALRGEDGEVTAAARTAVRDGAASPA